MARGVNRVILVGSLGKDPEVRYSPNGTAVANVSIATSEEWKDKTTGQKQKKTEWHNLVFWGKLAEIVGEYLKKGALIYVEGSLYTEKWQDKEGKDRYTTKIKATEMQMLGGRNNAEAADGDDEPAPAKKPKAAEPERAVDTNQFDDDIPFS